MGTAERALVDEEYRGLRGKGFIDPKLDRQNGCKVNGKIRVPKMSILLSITTKNLNSSTMFIIKP